MIQDNFISKHNGPRENDMGLMLRTVGVKSVDELIDQTIPENIRMEKPLNLPKGMNEYEYLSHIKEIASKNKIFKTYIGMGYYNTITPGVIQRNILENPGWYTSYTPYQAEISQGRLEALLNFQTMICDLTAMPIANASLLDEATAAAEAMIMLYNSRTRKQVKDGINKFFAADHLFPQTLDVLKTRAKSLEIDLEIGNIDNFSVSDGYFGIMVQYPDQWGNVNEYKKLVKDAHDLEQAVVVVADILSLTLLTPPGEWDADVVVGSTQRFGIPMGYGGPHAGYFAAQEKYKRNIPGRIIGVSVDAKGDVALRMALQTREQHIKRERATSNICTAQALLASMAGFYAAYHGPEGLKIIARDISLLTAALANALKKMGYGITNQTYFDTLTVSVEKVTSKENIKKLTEKHGINLRYSDDSRVGISIDETTSKKDIELLIELFAQAGGKKTESSVKEAFEPGIPKEICRKTSYLQHEVFNSYHSETEMMRYMKYLENKDLALNRTMIPLGSCTMKLNAAAELFSLSWPEFGQIHPFVPAEQAKGYHELIENLEKDLCEITGFSAVSFQPNSGASGEYTGLLVIREYLESTGQGHRNICLIPASAHGTNPASSVMAGLKVVVVKCDDKGNIDIPDLKEKADKHKNDLAAIMITYPSTHGVFEEGICEIINIIHEAGGQVYMDGANMNAQVGLTSPGLINADVCHLNLHKTFAIPHGGGGPGVGPIGVAEHLAKFLPGHALVETGGKNHAGAVAAAPFGSASILTISYGYIKLLGGTGLTEATKIAILNANYLNACLKDHFKILYTGKNNRVAHEMILDCTGFSKSAGISVIDIAKRLMDYGFHAPTVAFPVPGTLMVEPTESEPLRELDRFVEAMIAIRKEIEQIETGDASPEINIIKSAPHTMEMIILDEWDKPYSKEAAAFPVKFLRTNKYWPPVTRIDDAHGDRHLMCTCLPLENYELVES